MVHKDGFHEMLDALKDGLLEKLDALIVEAQANNLQIRALLINQDLYMGVGSLFADCQPDSRTVIYAYRNIPVWPDAGTEDIGIVAHNVRYTTKEMEFGAIQIEAVSLLEKMARLDMCSEIAAQTRLVLDALKGIRAGGDG
jgi:hypothetical protein